MPPDVLAPSAVAAALCTGALLAAGCGSTSGPVAAGSAATLHKDVAAIRSAAAAHNPAAAHAAVATLEADIRRYRAAGMLATADAGVLLSDASQANRQISLEVHARAPATTPTAAAPPAPAPGGKPPGPAAGGTPPTGPAGPPGGPGHGKGLPKHGRGGGDGGDGGD